MTEQEKREKVIRGLECCTKDECECCPYEDVCFGDDEVELFDTLARDALALLKAQEPVVMAGAELTDAELIDAIRKAPITLKPAVDAVPVVRCRDCKHRIVNKNAGKKGYMGLEAMCDLDTGDIFELGRNAEDPDWFCADGERRDDDAAD